jgi:hypothetical protein
VRRTLRRLGPLLLLPVLATACGPREEALRIAARWAGTEALESFSLRQLLAPAGEPADVDCSIGVEAGRPDLREVACELPIFDSAAVAVEISVAGANRVPATPCASSPGPTRGPRRAGGRVTGS